MTTATVTCAGCKHAYADTALFCPNCGRPKAREQVQDALVGKVLGERFQVIELIGQGGSGTIYRAEHVTLRRKVAIKVLHTELSRDDLAIERFRREATTVAEIDNEHIVEIHDFGRTHDGRLYLAMELLEGETLDKVLVRDKTLSVEKVADILIQVGEALMEAHAIGYVHRDLRPRNIYLAVRRGKANFVKLLDFGLAKLVESDAQAASTSLGMTFGDPRYMSPEQARGDRIDRRADIYQLGCMAYEMLTGAPPFVGNRVFDILTKQVTEIPAPLPSKRPGVPMWMEAAVAKMLAKDPENRFATTTRMVEALRRGLDTGEVMEDEIARRRESIPPPSVSRVMQRMGMTSPTDTPREVPRVDAPAPAPEAAKPEPRPDATMLGTAPMPKPMAPASKPIAQPSAQPAPQPAPPAEAPRRRTGTPQVGVPVINEERHRREGVESPRAKTPTVPPPAERPRTPTPAPVMKETVREYVQPPVTGVIASRDALPTRDQPSGRTKRASSSGGQPDGIGISQVWYEDGERASEEADGTRPEKARKAISPGTTDLSLYDEPVPRKRWPLLAGAAAVVVVIGGTIAFALTRSGKDTSPPPPPPPQVAAATAPTIDAALSQEIDTPDAAVAQVAAPPDAAAAPPVKKEPAHPVVVAKDHERPPTDFNFGKDDNKHHPVDTTPDHTTVIVPVNTNKGSGSSPTGVSGGHDGPVDPYGGDTPADPGDGASSDKKAEFFANLGQQQLISGDTAGAAANFKKAAELDVKNVAAVTGMGEIALRQGLFGDAIAHLRKAAKLAPKSSRVYTLMGDAYLGSGQNAQAAENYKKALQLDPDNARARDGYNEASSRVPPPSDDN